jgi:hypothetical protein
MNATAGPPIVSSSVTDDDAPPATGSIINGASDTVAPNTTDCAAATDAIDRHANIATSSARHTTADRNRADQRAATTADRRISHRAADANQPDHRDVHTSNQLPCRLPTRPRTYEVSRPSLIHQRGSIP